MNEEIGVGASLQPQVDSTDQNFNEFLDMSGWSLFDLQAKYFFNWQQLGIYNTGIKKKKKHTQKLRIRLFI